MRVHQQQRQEDSPDLFCTVVSLVPFEITESKPGLFPPHYNIKQSDTRTCQVVHVGTAAHFVYMDETRGSLRIPTPSNIIAKSVVNDFITGQLNVSADCLPALFWVPGKLSADEVHDEYADKIDDMLMKQHNWFTAMCRLADDDFTRYQKHNVVSDIQRRVAVLLGWEPREHAWMRQGRQMNSKACAGCGNVVVPNVAKCVCGVILDRELYDSLDYGDKAVN